MYCQSMVHLVEHQISEWEAIEQNLQSLGDSLLSPVPVTVPVEAQRAPVAHEPNRAPAEQERQGQAGNRQRDQQAQAQMGIRIGHLIRGLVLIYALSLPRMFYYIFAGYSLLLLTGLFDNLQRLPLRRFLSGARPSLDIQLTRLRQRLEYMQRLQDCESSPIEEEELNKMKEFLGSFERSRVPFWRRFIYQLFVMFFYSAFPACHPHSEYLS